jgi:hypothetical protein
MWGVLMLNLVVHIVTIEIKKVTKTPSEKLTLQEIILSNDGYRGYITSS